MSRARRLNNPGNIRITTPRTPWQERVPTEHMTDTQFEQFTGPEWGTRALARTLITYQDKHNLRTIGAILNRWAPPKGQDNDGQAYEQNTAAYIRHVEQLTGFDADQILDLHTWAHLRPLVGAIAHHESGFAWDDDILDQGVILAGVRPAERPLLQTKTGAGIAIAGIGSVLQSTDIAETASQIAPLAKHSAVIAGIVVAVIVIGLGLALYGRWHSKRRTGV